MNISITDQLERYRKRRGRGEQGFTLIELLIVILVLSILAGIAIFASAPFRDRAEAACGEANDKIKEVAAAAIEAGVDENLYVEGQEPSDCEPGSGGGGGTTGFTASHVQADDAHSTTGTASVTLNGVQDGNLVVAVSGHRTNVSGTTPPDPTVTGGFTLQGSQAFSATGTSDRRGVAVWTKVSGGGDETFSVDWGGGGTSVILREFSRGSGTWAESVVFAKNEPPGGDTTDSLSTGDATRTGSNLVIAAVSTRNDATAGGVVSDFSWDSVVGGNLTASGSGGVFTAVGWANGTGGNPSASWTNEKNAVGLTLLVR